MRTLKVIDIFVAIILAASAWVSPMYGEPVQTADKLTMLFPVRDNFLSGYIDKTGKVVCSGYEVAGDFSDGLAAVMVGGKYGFIESFNGKLRDELLNT